MEPMYILPCTLNRYYSTSKNDANNVNAINVNAMDIGAALLRDWQEDKDKSGQACTNTIPPNIFNTRFNPGIRKVEYLLIQHTSRSGQCLTLCPYQNKDYGNRMTQTMSVMNVNRNQVWRAW